MICDPCKKAAEVNKAAAAIDGVEEGLMLKHPQNCGCPCQHKPVGAWKGKK